MFICEECNKVFDDPITIEEYHPYGMGYATERWNACPHCESTDIVEVEQCQKCEEYVEELVDGELCQRCYEDLYGECDL